MASEKPEAIYLFVIYTLNYLLPDLFELEEELLLFL